MTSRIGPRPSPGPKRPPERLRPRGLASAARALPPGIEQVALEEDAEQDRDEDPELGLDDRGDDRQDRRPLGPVAPQLAQGEQQEDEADRIDLGPDGAVEPGHRVDHEQQGARGAPPGATAELEDERWTSQATATSARIAGILIRSPMPPSQLPTIPTSHRT